MGKEQEQVGGYAAPPRSENLRDYFAGFADFAVNKKAPQKLQGPITKS